MNEGVPKPDAFKKVVDDTVDRVDDFLSVGKAVSRRELLGTLAAVGVSGALMYGRKDEEDTFISTPAKAEVRAGELNAEAEPHTPSEAFMHQRDTFMRAYGTLTTKQIQFIADNGAPLGEPFDVAPINGIDPGRLNEDGVIAEGIRTEWLDEARAFICRQFTNQTCDIQKAIPRQTNSIAMVRLAKARTPGLRAETMFDVVEHFGNEKVAGVPDAPTRIEYVRQHIGESTSLPQHVVHELQHIVPGQAAQESQYDGRAVSKVGAEGIFQFMPDTWEGLGFREAEAVSLPHQVLGASKFFDTAYRYFTTNRVAEITVIREQFFDNDEALFSKHFLVPLLINSYNSGPARVAAVLTWFVRTFPEREKFEEKIGAYPNGFGYDLYATMASLAKERKAIPGYGKDSSEYFVRSAAFAELIKERIPQSLTVTVDSTTSILPE